MGFRNLNNASSLLRPSRQMATLSLVIAGLILSSCASFGTRAASDGDDYIAKTEGSVIVQQGGRKDPVVSKHERNFWLDARSSAKSSVKRMHAALATGETEAAIAMAREHLIKRPGDTDAFIVLATGLAMKRQYELASYYANLVEKRFPNHPVALNIKGMASMISPNARIRDYQNAIKIFEKAFENPGEIAPGLNLGHLYLELGNAAKAAEVFGETARRCGNCAPALLGYGTSLARTGQYEAAKKSFEEILAKRPNHAGALYNLALVYKNGYNNNKKAETYLFAIINDSRIRDITVKERAQVVLRLIKAEASPKERTHPASKADEEDAAMLMSGNEFTE